MRHLADHENVTIIRPHDSIPHYHYADWEIEDHEAFDWRNVLRTKCGVGLRENGRRKAVAYRDPHTGMPVEVRRSEYVEHRLQWGFIELPLRHARAFAEPCKRCFR